MQRGILLAEKPSVMREIQKVYSTMNLPFELDFGAFHGHLMALKQPEDYSPAWADRNDASVLPMIPQKFEYVPEDVDSVRKLMEKIQKGNYDFMVNACDAGREGELIFYSFYETMGLTLPVKRLWTSSVTKPALKKALQTLQESNLYDGLRQAAKYRAQFDWLVGMNFTRAASIATRRFIPIGRVQSPTLKLIVDRELEIQGFVPKDYYEVTASVSINAGEPVKFTHLVAPAHKDSRFDSKDDAEAVVNDVKAAKTGKVVSVKNTVKETDAPTLYSLAELQKDANKYLKFKPDHTLEIAQKLYEGGWLTYPRTESRYLPTDMIPEIPQHLAPLASVPELAGFVSGIGQHEIDVMLKKNYVNDAGITDHHAIIPTDQVPNWSALSKDEQEIYTLVGKSFLAIFMPPYKTANSSILVDINGHWFQAKGKQELDKGYGVLYASSKTKDVILPTCNQGDTATFTKPTVTQKTTKPPERYTPRSILAAMQTAGSDLSDAALRKVLKESAGLGTSATRADILKKLEDRELVEVKNNAYYALDKGIKVVKAVGDRTFSSALLTAQWESKLSEVEKGEYSGNFENEMREYVKDETAFLLSLSPANRVVGKCPLCGGEIIETEKSYMCKNHKQEDASSCQVLIPKKIGGHEITAEELNDLIVKQRTEPMILITKKGKPWNVFLTLEPGDGFVIRDNEKRNLVGKCPLCGGDVVETENGFVCTKHKDACAFWVPKVIGGHTITEDELHQLLTQRKTGKTTIYNKSGNPWDVFLVVDKDNGFSVQSAEERKLIAKCPVCGSPVYAGANSYYCSNRNCGLSISRVIKGARIEEDDAIALLSGRKTRVLNFIWGSGKTGQARLFLTGKKLQWEFLH